MTGAAGTADQARAALRCEELLQETLLAVRPGLTWSHGVPSAGLLARTGAVDSTSDPAPPTWFVARNRNVLTVISPARRGALLGVVERHWRACGHTLTGANADRESPGLYAATADGFRLALDFGVLGNAYLTALSPGVARSEQVPHPPGTPGIARHPGTAVDLAPPPAVYCSFWSAHAPG
ncbi:hypothetical protein OG455_38515 [Kitasatospora sp. NBC_01287]|uniref:hypothetical protein n=1 Tax=Kitasatospora sp. NBC_01287 TaxID=2903573 RepID=UPI002256BCA5|nr:hypothetical protein [Kitasatospora sp. NBC_01287]MCX4751330.1 hypothetical protein [Kitasatospora sp. NBC_01287]